MSNGSGKSWMIFSNSLICFVKPGELDWSRLSKNEKGGLSKLLNREENE